MQKWPRLYAVHMQSAALATLMGRLAKNLALKHIGFHWGERGISAAWFVFIRNMVAHDLLDHGEMFALRTLYNACKQMEEACEHKVGAVIIFHPPLDVCWERVQRRGQTGDAEIKLEYLEQIHSQYERYITEEPARGREIAVIREVLEGDLAAKILGEVWAYVLLRAEAGGDFCEATDQTKFQHRKYMQLM